MKVSLLVVALLAVGCSAGAPSSPSPAAPTPTAIATSAPTATLAPTPSAAPSATAGSSCDPYYDPCNGPSATPAPSASTVSLSADGTYLVSPNGFTLYVFDLDSAGQSACTSSECTGAWSALTVASGASPTAGDGVTGTLSTFDRGGGVMQVQYNDRPLYNYLGDSKPTDTSGDGVNNVWHLAKP